MALQNRTTTDDEKVWLVKAHFLAVFSSPEGVFAGPAHPDWGSSAPVSDINPLR